MISETEFAQMGDSLSTGFLIDKVVTSLARTQRLGHIQKEDQPTIQEALRILQRVLDGERWLGIKQFDAQSGESALAFDRAVSALSLQARVPSEFASHVTHLEEILNTLIEKGVAPDKEIKRVRDFFSKYGRRVFIEAQSIIDRSGEPQGLRLWNQPKRESI